MSSETEGNVLVVTRKSIEPNPDNPRRLFDPVDMEALKKSIHLRGIMVPLIVFRNSPNSDKFTLLDGERRLRCAKELRLDEISVREITKPNRLENIIRMFNIHNVRQNWELVPTAYALEKMVKLLEKEGKKTTNGELSKLTGMTTVRVSECKRVMKYKQYLHLSLDSNPDKRIGGDFFSQLDLVLDKLEKYPEILQEFSKKKLIDIMINKKQDGIIENILTEFRTLKRVLTSSSKGVEKKRIVENVKNYIKAEPKISKDTKTRTSSFSAQKLYEQTSESIFTEQEIIKKASELHKLLNQIHYSELTHRLEFKQKLLRLQDRINKILKKLE